MKAFAGIVFAGLSIVGLAHQNTIVKPPAVAVTFPKAIHLSPAAPLLMIAPIAKHSKTVAVVPHPVRLGVVLGTSTLDREVTQSELQAAIQQASNALRQLIYANAGTVGQGQYSTGGFTNNLALSSRIDQLSGTTLTNVVVNSISGLRATDIPDLSASYLSTTGGTIAGGLTVTGSLSVGSLSLNTSSTTNSVATNATTTNLSTTNLTITSLGPSAGQCLTINSSGTVATTTCGGGSSFNYPFPSNATTTRLIFNGGLTATGATLSSTTLTGNFVFANATGTNATTTSFAISGVSSGNLLKTTTGGAIVAATAGTDYLTSASGITSISAGNVTTTGAAVTLATSTLSFNGLTLGQTIVNSSGTYTFTPTVSGTLNNAGLTNSTIGATSPNSTISFGSSAALGSTFTGDLNLGHSNWWTAAQNFTNASTSQFTATSSVWFTGITSSLLLNDSTGKVGAYGGASCTNQFVRSLNGAGAATCATVQNADLANSSLTINTTYPFQGGATISLGGSATLSLAFSTTTSNTWAGTQTFGNTTNSGTLSVTGQTALGQASTTLFSALGPAYFGSTATSSFSTTGALTLATALTVGNGGTGQTSFTNGAPTFYDGSKLSSVKKTYVNATCNGITDDATTINNAIANAPSGTTLILPSGTCYIGSTIQWPTGKNSVTLEGGGSGATVITTDQNITMVKIGTYTYSGTDTWSFPTYATYYIGINDIYFQNTGSTKTNTIGVDIRGAQHSRFENLTFNGIWDGIVINPVSDWNYFDEIRGIGPRNTIRVQGDGYTLNYNSTGNTYNNISGPAASTSIMQFTGCTFGDSTITNVIGTGVASGGSGSGGGAIAAVYFNSPGTNCTDGSTRYASRISVSGVDMDGASDYVVRGTYADAIDVGNYAQGGTVTTGVSFDTNSTNVRRGAWALNGSNLSYSSGNVGIGTTSPSKPFTVYSSGSNVSGIFGDNTAALGMGQLSSTGILQAYTNTSAAAVANLTLQPSGGKVGIGSVSPSARLAVTGASSPAGSIFNLTTATGATTDEHLEMGIVDGSYSWIQAVKQGTAYRNLSLEPSGGNVGIGTTNPYSRLSVWGTDTASSTLAFNIVNSASTTLFAVFDGGNAQLSGTLTQSSDRRLKTNIEMLDASSSLASINSLTPVAYDWLDPDKGGVRQYGFIAQDVQQIFPNLVATTSATALTPDGTLGLNYLGLIAPIVKAVQQLSADIASLASRVSSLEAAVAGFANSFTTRNLCVADDSGKTCISRSQLQALLTDTPTVQISAPTPIIISGTTSPPLINIQGSNPATISVGDTYVDLGAIVHDNQGHDLSYRIFINGVLAGNILIDTSQVATDTIDYVATDTWGNTATSTRTVIIKAVASSTAAQ